MVLNIAAIMLQHITTTNYPDQREFLLLDLLSPHLTG